MTKDPQTKKRDAKTSSFLLPFILIFIGAIFLLNNFGILPWNIWNTLWLFWPLLLVIAGLQLIAGDSIASRMVVVFFAAISFLLVFVFSLLQTSQGFRNWLLLNYPQIKNLAEKVTPTRDIQMEGEKIVVKGNIYDKVDKRKVEMELGAGDFVLKEDSSDNFFQIVTSNPRNWSTPEVETGFTNGLLSIEVDAKGSIPFGQGEKPNYQMSVGQLVIPTDFDVKMGAGKFISNFESLDVRQFDMDLGAGEAKVEFTSDSLPDEMDIDVGAGKLEIKLPQNIGFKIDYEIGLGDMQIDSAKLRGRGVYQTDNYSFAEEKTEMSISLGVGSVEINR